MFTRERSLVDDSSLSVKVRNARALLKRKNWSYRNAAPVLGVSYQHLAMVLTGRRESRRLLAAIEALPPRSDTQSAA